jgi:hypothetical protein
MPRKSSSKKKHSTPSKSSGGTSLASCRHWIYAANHNDAKKSSTGGYEQYLHQRVKHGYTEDLTSEELLTSALRERDMTINLLIDRPRECKFSTMISGPNNRSIM